MAAAGAVHLGALALANPVLAAAGAVGYGAEWARLGPLERLGAVVTGGVAAHTRRGPPASIVEAAAGALYRPGARWLGAAAAVRRFGRVWAAAVAPVIVNLEADSASEFAAAAADLEGVRGVAAVELNLAGADAESGHVLGHRAEHVAQIVRATRQACALPVLAKLPADAPSLDETVRACAAAGAAAVVLAGGLPAGDGLLVGPATFPVIHALVARLAPRAEVPVVACGGVATAEHAAAYLRAGAAAVEVGSAHLVNPRAAGDVAEGLGY